VWSCTVLCRQKTHRSIFTRYLRPRAFIAGTGLQIGQRPAVPSAASSHGRAWDKGDHLPGTELLRDLWAPVQGRRSSRRGSLWGCEHKPSTSPTQTLQLQAQHHEMHENAGGDGEERSPKPPPGRFLSSQIKGAAAQQCPRWRRQDRFLPST